MPSFARGLVVLTLGIAILAGCSRTVQGHDAVLSFGRVFIGEDARTFFRDFGTGTSAKRADIEGTVRDIELYRHGRSVLAVGISAGRVGNLVAYERLSDAKVAREFAIASGRTPAETRVPIDSLQWLGLPLFSDRLAETPDGWRVPTDFTVASSRKDFIVVDGDRMALKTSSPDYGWVIAVR